MKSMIIEDIMASAHQKSLSVRNEYLMLVFAMPVYPGAFRPSPFPLPPLERTPAQISKDRKLRQQVENMKTILTIDFQINNFTFS